MKAASFSLNSCLKYGFYGNVMYSLNFKYISLKSLHLVCVCVCVFERHHQLSSINSISLICKFIIIVIVSARENESIIYNERRGGLPDRL